MEARWRAAVDERLAPWDRPDAPGGAVGIYREGERVYGRGFGLADLEHGVAIDSRTVFHVASISKQVTALVVALLARDGALSLDDRLASHVPELRVSEPIRLRQVLYHTSGLRDQWDLLRLAGWRHADLKTNGDVLRLATRQRELNFAPGTRFQYINTGYTLLGIVVERVTGESLGTVARRRVFEPLGMADTTFDERYGRPVPRRARAYVPDGDGGFRTDIPAYETVGPTGLLSTIDDFARWERNFLDPTVGDRRLLDAMTRRGELTAGRTCAYGMGLALGEHRGLETVEHAGGDADFRAHFLRIPSERFAVAVFTNRSDATAGTLAREVADLCLEGELPAAPASAGAGAVTTGRAVGIAAPAPEELAGRAGLYRDGASGMTCRIDPRGGRLFLLAGGSEYELLPIGEGRFRFLDVDAECRFEPAGMEVSTRLIVWNGGEESGRCERIEAEAEVAAEALAACAGVYESEELEMRYAIELAEDGDGLALHRPRFPPARLRPVSADELTADGEGFHLRLCRGEDGRVEGFRLSAERVWNVAFTRT